MRVYFVGDNQAEEKFQKRFSTIVDLLNNAGVITMSNLVEDNLASFSSQDLEKIGQSGEVLIERMDALIIEGSKPVAESGYLIAIALAHQKPILYLVEKGKSFNKNLQHLQTSKNMQKLLHLEHYSEKTLQDVVMQFIQNVEQGEGKELPTIKFTLRITPRIERYLQWRTHNTKLTKADYLRDVIEKIIDTDEQYQKFIRHQDEAEAEEIGKGDDN